jgi:alpha-L-fucosidase
MSSENALNGELMTTEIPADDAALEVAEATGDALGRGKDWIPVFIPPTLPMEQAELPPVKPWGNRLEKRGYLNSPLMETTPFVFQERLYRLENWQKIWDYSDALPGTHFHEDEVRIRDVERDELISVPLRNHAFGMAFVWQDTVYVFAGDYGTDKPWRQVTELTLTTSKDLVNWTEPQVVLRAKPGEHYFNFAVCRGREQFVLLYETDEPGFAPAFTFKYCVSDDLLNWQHVPNAVYGREKYVGGPALYFEGDTYYTLYLHALDGRWETRITRSRDLVSWEDAPVDRPFVTFDDTQMTRCELRPAVQETNASDAELCAWKGKTLVYFSGSNQVIATADLQWAEFPGSPRELLEHFFDEPEVVLPSPQQLAYQELEIGTFVHFGPATYTGDSDMLIVPPAAIFNPEKLDADQWVRAAKAAGTRTIVLTTKHHNGFCLWPTATTEYSVRHSPWKDGTGDVVREFVEAARRHDLKIGFYFSLGDKHWGCYSTPEPLGERHMVGDRAAFLPVVQAQLTELLTNYGEIDLVWFDGAYDPYGWDVMNDRNEILGTTAGDSIAALVHHLQQNATLFGGTRTDGHWAGNESGTAPSSIWNAIAKGTGFYLSPEDEGWFYSEAVLFTRAHWFWTPHSDDTLRSLEELIDIYNASIGHGATLLMNLTPDTDGLIPAAEVERMREFGETVRALYGTPLAVTDSTQGWSEDTTLYLKLDHPQWVDRVVLEEDLRSGQRVRAYVIEVKRDGHWSKVSEDTSIGRKRIAIFQPVEVAELRLRILKTDPLPKVRHFSIHAATTS